MANGSGLQVRTEYVLRLNFIAVHQPPIFEEKLV